MPVLQRQLVGIVVGSSALATIVFAAFAIWTIAGKRTIRGHIKLGE